MTNFIENSVFLGAVLSLVAYEAGMLLKRKFKLAIFNPLLIAILCVMGVLSLLGVDYDTYNKVCEDYRKTCIALQEREAEVADLLKQNEAKALTVKLLQDRLQLYGVTVNDESPSLPPVSDLDDQAVQLQKIIHDQKQVIQTLLGGNGEKGGFEKVESVIVGDI